MNLTILTPAEIDVAWAEAIQPIRVVLDRINENRKATNRYLKARWDVPAYLPKQLAEHKAKLETLHELEAPFIAEFNSRGGWSRAYVVSGGHIHRHTSCHSLKRTTLLSWLPELSGADESAIVERAGEGACTFCFSSAPVAAR
jgi:hypothetical protein